MSSKTIVELAGNPRAIKKLTVSQMKLLCGQEFGLSYTENQDGGVTAHILLPIQGGSK